MYIVSKPLQGSTYALTTSSYKPLPQASSAAHDATFPSPQKSVAQHPLHHSYQADDPTKEQVALFNAESR